MYDENWKRRIKRYNKSKHTNLFNYDCVICDFLIKELNIMGLKEEIKSAIKENGHNLFDYNYTIHDFVVNENELDKVVESIIVIMEIMNGK